MTALLKHTVLAAVVALGLIGVGLSGDGPPPRQDNKPTNGPAAERIITGKVVGADGRPVRAALSLVRPDRERLPLGRTADDGTFRVTVPREADGTLVAEAAGHGLDFLPLGPAADVTLTLPTERPLRGRVLDLQGKPVVAATVTAASVGAFNPDTNVDLRMTGASNIFAPFPVTPKGDRTLNSPAGITATTDKDGRFEFRGLGAGHLLTLRVRAAGVADAEYLCLNRDGFDPTEANAAARRAEELEAGRLGDPNTPWRVCGPDPTIVVEPEKVIRGTVTDPTGKPRAGVRVTFSRPNKDDVLPSPKSAVTDAAGRYEIHGAARHPGYMVECGGDAATAILPCQGFATDTAGYEPVGIDLKCAKGVIVTGTVRNKATGKPVVADIDVEVLVNNPFVAKYPPYMHGTGPTDYRFRTDRDGRFRVVTVPGPVLLLAYPQTNNPFKPAVPDPKYPAYFSTDGDQPMFAAYSDGAAVRGMVRGSWCRVLDLKPTDEAVTVDVELEPAGKGPRR